MFRHAVLPRLVRRMVDEGGVRLGRPLGIDVHLHPGGLFLLLVLTASLTRALGDRLAPFPGTAGALIGSAGVALALAASVLLHELAHAVVARRHGVPVRGVLLHLLGGAVRFDRPPQEPGVEMRVAAAGPLANLGLAAVGLGFTFALGRVDPSSPATLAAALLTLGNGAMGLVNLLPAYPLDGGRILRASLWQLNGCRHRSTWLAARAARAFAWTSVVAGVWLVFQAGPWALPVAMLGWFVGEEAARCERRTTAYAPAVSSPRAFSPPASSRAAIASPQRAGGRLQVTTAKPSRTTNADTLASTPKKPPVQIDVLDDVSRSTGSS
jgi:Zn-dependent protease